MDPFFAVNSRVPDFMVLMVGFSVHFTAPVEEGELRAVGRVVHEGGRLFGGLLATGSGTFTRSAIRLDGLR